MEEIIQVSENPSGLEDAVIHETLSKSLGQYQGSLHRVLLLPPDFTRNHSGAGKITAMLYKMLSASCEIDIMPALGTHMPMDDRELAAMFGPDIPRQAFIDHHWRTDVVTIGTVPGDYIREISDGLIEYDMDVQVNKRLLDPAYDLIISIGQVVPHEVVGMANYNKNIFVGCGGTDMINKSHMLGAVYGMERMMGRDHTPVRKAFDYAEQRFLQQVPLLYLLTVTTQREGRTCINGLFAGRSRHVFEEAVALSQQKNLTFVEEPFHKVVVYLDPEEFKSTWLGNKAVYRTRMAIADDGELVVLAPGVRQFGEDMGIDQVIRQYGYAGRDSILAQYQTEEALRNNLSVAAHLIHGSSDGRFTITYAVSHLTQEEIEGAGFQYLPYEEAVQLYDPRVLKDGYNTLPNGETIYYISNPAVGLWALKEHFQ